MKFLTSLKFELFTMFLKLVLDYNSENGIKTINENQMKGFLDATTKHLETQTEQMNKLIDKVGEEKANDYVNNVLNYRKNTKYKSLYLTALKWIDRDSKKTTSSGLQKSTKLA